MSVKVDALFAGDDPEGPTPAPPRILRLKKLLAIAIVTDEADCSTRPDGQVYFYDQMFDAYWPVDPDEMIKKRATSATCWYSGVDCGMPDMNGVYADCVAVDNGVLHAPELNY